MATGGDVRMVGLAWLVHQACNHIGWLRRKELKLHTAEEKNAIALTAKIRQQMWELRQQEQIQIQEQAKGG